MNPEAAKAIQRQAKIIRAIIVIVLIAFALGVYYYRYLA